MKECIFVSKPPECSACLDTLVLRCLDNHRHLILSEEGKKRVLVFVTEEMYSPRRYKTVSGQEQRKDGNLQRERKSYWSATVTYPRHSVW